MIPRAYAEPGDHIRLGEAELTPSLTMGLDWHSNVYRTAGELGGEDPTIGGTNLNLGPKLVLQLETPEVILAADGKYLLRKFLDPDQANLDSFSEVDLGLNLELLPKAVVGFKTRNSLRRNNYPTEATEAEQALMSRTHADLFGFASVHPGAALSVDVGGWYAFDNYQISAETTSDTETTSAGKASLNNKNTFGPKAELKWTFFPKTALVSNLEVGFIRWEDHLVNSEGDSLGNSQDLGTLLAIPDANYWKADIGIVGRFTQRLVLNVLVGYGMANYDEDSVTDDPEAGSVTDATELDAAAVGFDQDVRGLPGLLLTTGAEWTPRTGHTLSAGYNKNFDNSWFTNYIAYNYLYLRYRAELIQDVALSAETGYRYESYAGEVNRHDHYLRFKTGVSYAATGWMDAALNLGWTRRASADDPPVPSIEYDDLQIAGQLTFSY